MNSDIENIVICDAVRTPFCHSHQFQSETPVSLLKCTIIALMERNAIPPEVIDGVIAGTVMNDSRWTNVARMTSLDAGLLNRSMDYSIQGNCNSGFMALLSAVNEIVTGNGSLYIAGGTELMSQYGFRLRDKATGRDVDGGLFVAALEEKGKGVLEEFVLSDSVQETLTDCDHNMNMAEVAEIMASYYGISRIEQDEFAKRSLENALFAVENGILANYITPVGDVKLDSYPLNRKRLLKRKDGFSRGKPIFNLDENELSPNYFVEKNEKFLKPLGITDITPTVTMYNATVPGDGAGAAIVTTESRALALGLTPRIRIVNWEKIGVNPTLMGIGPSEATFGLFLNPKTDRSKDITFNQIDIIEIHEAFASQVLSVFKQGEQEHGMLWDMNKINTLGGSLAFTHPLGATNFRLITNILSRFDEDPSARYALGASCAGGGMGVSVLFERY